MSGYSIGTYSGGTAFVGLGSFLPPFHLPFGGTALQRASITSVAIGAGFGVYATYAGFFDGTVRVPKKIAKAQVFNATAFEVYEDVGIHWMDYPAGYFPLNIPAHVDDGNASSLLSAFDASYGECIAEEAPASVKWMDYPAGYFPLNIPAFVDNGKESVLESTLRSEPIACALDEAPVPIKWLEYTTEFVPSSMDLFVDDIIPFGYPTNTVCPSDSEKIERAFFTLRNPPTLTQFKATPVQPTIDTPAGSVSLIIAIATTLSFIIGTMFLTLESRYSTLTADNEPLEPQLEEKPDEIAKKKALEAALYKLGATPASRIGGCRRRTKKPNKTNKTKQTNKSTNSIDDIEKHSFSIAPVLEALD